MTEKKIRGVSRRDVLKGSAVATVGVAAGTMGFPAITRSQQQKRFLKPIVAGLNGKEMDPSTQSISLIPKILKEKYDVDMKVEVHSASTLGTDIGQLDAVKTGFIDITSNASAAFSGYSDALIFLDLPYLFNDWDHALRFIKTSDLVKKQSAKFEKDYGVKLLPFVGAGGYRMLTNRRRALQSPKDVAGLKFRGSAGGSPADFNLIRGWGGNPTPIPFVELYTAIQQGVVDGMYIQPIWTYNFNFHEVAKFTTLTGGVWVAQTQVMNINTWNSMPEAIQKAFWNAAQDAADQMNVLDRKLEDEMIANLKAKGQQIYQPSAAEMKEFKDIGLAMWDDKSKTNVDPSVVKEAREFKA